MNTRNPRIDLEPDEIDADSNDAHNDSTITEFEELEARLTVQLFG